MKKSQMSQSRMSVAGQSQFRKHRSPRILPNQVRETPSLPVRRVRKDVLLDERHALLPSPTSKSYFRWGHRLSESRVSAFPRFSRVKGIAWNTVARWLEKTAQVCRRFNHRRIAGFAAEELQADEIRTFRGQQEDTELGLRYNRSLVSALAIDGDGKAKLREHSRLCFATFRDG